MREMPPNDRLRAAKWAAEQRLRIAKARKKIDIDCQGERGLARDQMVVDAVNEVMAEKELK